MTIEYRVIKTMSKDLLGVDSDEHGRQLFTARALRKKPRKCAVCGIEIPKGARAFGPIDNGMNRMDRVHEECLSKW